MAETVVTTLSEDEQLIESGRKLREHQISAILDEFKALRRQGYGIVDACNRIAPKYNRTGEGIRWVVNRFRPTTGTAGDYIRANALRLAMRTVRKANVEQAIDILSRPNVGVLEPSKGAMSGNGGGFFLSVTADTCGAVKVGIAQGEGAAHALKTGVEQWKGSDEPDEDTRDPFAEAREAAGTVGAARREEVTTIQRVLGETPQRLLTTGRGTGHSKKFRDAIAASKQRIQEARERAEKAEIARKTREIKKSLRKPIDDTQNPR